MILSSWPQLAFLVVAWAVYWLLPGPHGRRAWLAFASIGAFVVFQSAASWWMLPFGLLAWTAFRMSAAKTRGPFVVSLIALLAVLAVFKYALPSVSAGYVAPVGVSYLCFQAILAAVERRRGQSGDVRPTSFLAYFFFFPTVVSGPIKSLRRFMDSEPQGRAPHTEDLAAGVTRILQGLAKKLVLAETLAPLTAGFAHPAQATTLELWIAVYAYAFQLYFDFSGYTDIAVGMARLFGYRIEETFDWPYLKTNLRDFWRSWHMSLTGFMRDVVYIPLGGNRRGAGRLYLNLLIVFVLIGLWHGGEGHYLLWGLYHGTGMVAYRAWQRWRDAANRPARASRATRMWSWAATFHFVVFGWVLFACPTRDALTVYLGLMGGR
jgi:alginate O-acetyltransferase complex protein AlgI